MHRLPRLREALKTSRNQVLVVSALSLAVLPPTTMAEGKPNKPSIYDPPAPTRELVRNDPTPLESAIRDTRRSFVQTYNSTKTTITDLVDKWIGVEKQVESTLKDIAPKGEETIIPGAIYVGIAGMAGSIVARNRMFPIRFLSPLVAIGIAGWYFLPETTGNILELTKRYEERVPVLRDAHQKLSKDLDHLKQETVKEVEKVSDHLGISNK